VSRGEGECQLWDLDREADLPFPGGAAVVSAATWDDPGERLALGTPEGKVTVCRFPTGEVVQQVPYAGRITRLLFSSDGRYLVLAAGRRARVWDCQQSTFVTPDLEHPTPITTLAIHPQGRQLTTACQDQSCRIFTIPAENDRPLFPIIHHVQQNYRPIGQKPIPPTYVDEGRRLLTVSGGLLSWRNTTTGNVIHTLQLGPLDAIRVSPDGNFVVLAEDGVLIPRARFLKAATGEPTGSFMDHHANQLILAVAFSPDSKIPTRLTPEKSEAVGKAAVLGGLI
jgi:WD40 repeat protein